MQPDSQITDFAPGGVTQRTGRNTLYLILAH